MKYSKCRFINLHHLLTFFSLMDSSMVAMAQIILFGGNFAPRGTFFCAGQSLSIANYTALFSLLGTTFGGDGTQTFNLPDFRGRMALGTGSGPGLPSIQLGEVSGMPSVTLLSNQLPPHNHPVKIPTTSANGTSKSPDNAIAAGGAGNAYSSVASQDGGYGGVKVGVTGNNAPVNIQMPYLGLNFLIISDGVYPVRN